MREIKFKAWNGTSWENNHPFYLHDNEENNCHELKENGIIFLQFTGLKDKNGKEIYEGDIVNTDSDKGLQVGIGGYWETVGSNGNGVHVFNKDETRVFGVSPFDKDNNLEVIGNIYENPSLLEPNT